MNKQLRLKVFYNNYESETTLLAQNSISIIAAYSLLK